MTTDVSKTCPAGRAPYAGGDHGTCARTFVGRNCFAWLSRCLWQNRWSSIQFCAERSEVRTIPQRDDRYTSQEVTAPSAGSPSGRTVLVVWRLLAVLGALMLVGFCVVPYFCQASEDAIILFQYSLNLAKTGVISYIPHGPRAEGATDFLWMAWIALGARLGVPTYGLAIASSAASAVGLAVAMVRLARQRPGLVNIAAVVCLVLLVPQTFAAEAGFSVFCFALLLGYMAALTWWGRYSLAVIAGLLLCLIRPDGAVFAVPLLGVYVFRGEGFRARIGPLVGGFIVPGLVYFIWRWHYFGHLLPLPFYVKSDTARVFGVLVVKSAISLVPPLLAACVILAIALRGAMLRLRNLLLLGTLIVPSSMFYLAMRLDQNYANRFFLYPLVVMGVLLAGNFEIYRARAGRVLAAGLGVWVLVLGYFWVNWAVIYGVEYPQPHVVAVARELADLPGRGSMIVTESGTIPFYSKWVAYDPWGLNTPAFALHLIQPEDVRRLAPDLVIVHQETGPMPCAAAPETHVPGTVRSWNDMTQNVIGGVDPEAYTQWLLPQYNEYDRTHPRRWNGQRRYGDVDYQCWFIRNGYAESARVAGILREHGGMSATEYRERRP